MESRNQAEKVAVHCGVKEAFSSSTLSLRREKAPAYKCGVRKIKLEVVFPNRRCKEEIDESKTNEMK